MGIPVSIESAAGYSRVFVQTPGQASAEREKERTSAVRECQRLAREFEQTDPAKAAKCDAAAKDEKLTAYELFGLVKGTDLRPPLDPDPVEDPKSEAETIRSR